MTDKKEKISWEAPKLFDVSSISAVTRHCHNGGTAVDFCNDGGTPDTEKQCGAGVGDECGSGSVAVCGPGTNG